MKSIRGTMGGMPKSNFFSFQDIIMSVTGILIVISLMLALQIDKVLEPTKLGNLSTDDDPAAKDSDELQKLEMLVAEQKEKLQTLLASTRKSESEAELQAQITRLEERVLALTASGKSTMNPDISPKNLKEIRAKAAEILRLREEIRSTQADMARIAGDSEKSSKKMMELEKMVREMEALVATARAKSKGIHLIRELSDTTKEPIIVDVGENTLKLMRFDRPNVIQANSLADFYKVIRQFKKQDQYFVLYFRPDGAGRFEEIRQAVKNAGFEVGYDAIPQDADLALGK